MKMLLIVRTDLKMSHGKVASQCCHATLELYKKIYKFKKELIHWETNGQKKVVLKCPDLSVMFKIKDKAYDMNIPFVLIQDAGLTQIESGSYTVLALFGEENILSQITNHLKLY